MKPNIIFYFSDQQRADTLNQTLTPNLMRLAGEGVRFDASFTCQPVCGPARACLQSGQYATQTGAVMNGVPLDTNIKPLAKYLSEAGYHTAYIGKWHLASDLLPGVGVHCEATAVPKSAQGGYDYWRAADVLEFTSHGYDGYIFDGDGNKIEFKGYRADAINDFALEYLEKEVHQDEPFFMFVSQLEPHHQNDHHRYEGKEEYTQKFKNYPLPADLTFLNGDYKESYPDYVSAIASLDENVGKLVEKLKQKGLYQNTIIIYTSDHGSHFKTRNFEYKRCCHDSATHTPLVICGGQFVGGKVDQRLVSLIDLPATILDFAEVKVPEQYSGVSLNAQYLGTQKERDAVLIQISESQIGRAVRTARYTYSIRQGGTAWCFARFVLTKKSQARFYFEDYLYDNKVDPVQQNNLIHSKPHKKIKAELKALLVREMLVAGEKKPVILPSLVVKKK